MDIMNIFTAMTWACIGSSLVYSIFPNNIVYFTSYGIFFYYTFQKTEQIDSKYITKWERTYLH